MTSKDSLFHHHHLNFYDFFLRAIAPFTGSVFAALTRCSFLQFIQKTAGTKSNVYVVLSGEDDESEPQHLVDDKRPIFRSSDVNSFLLATARPLGELKLIKVWHDNSGKQVIP